jgi:rhodanese-related sulfurtransferase
MRSKLWLNISSVVILMALLMAMPLLSACGDKDSTTTTSSSTPTSSAAPSATATVTEKTEFDVVKDAVVEYLTHIVSNMKATELKLKIVEGEALYIVSLRSAEDYAKGHIPGAVNMKFSDITTLPKDKKIVVYCYTGQSSSFAAAVLGTLGYNVTNLLHGMSSWSNDPAAYVSRFDLATSSGTFETETTTNSGGSYSPPTLENTTSRYTAEIVLAAAKTVSPKYITATDLNMKIAEGEDMTVVDLRAAGNYATGHIPGAINVGLGALADNLDKINPDAPVYLHCYTGHSAAQGVALLEMLGYDAYSLEFGMCGWSSDPEINAGKCFNPDDSVEGFATEK